MSAYYDLYETPSPDGKEDKKSLHARICPKRTYTQKEFVEHVSTFQHLPKNVIGAALDACIDELCDLLANGNIVELGERCLRRYRAQDCPAPEHSRGRLQLSTECSQGR